MQFHILFPIVTLALASAVHSLKLPTRLIARSMDPEPDSEKQLLRGKVVVEDFSATFSQAALTIYNSAQQGDDVAIQQQLESIQISASRLTTYVESWDGTQRSFHQTTVIEIYASYMSMINAIHKTKNGGVVCHRELVAINAAFKSITSTYLAQGVNVQEEYEKENHDPEAQFDPEAFRALNLESPFQCKNDTVGESGQDENVAQKEV